MIDREWRRPPDSIDYYAMAANGVGPARLGAGTVAAQSQSEPVSSRALPDSTKLCSTCPAGSRAGASRRAVARHRRAVSDEALQQRLRKTRRFARAGFGRGHDVLATRHGRNRLGPHRLRCLVIEALQMTQQRLDQAKRGK